MEASMMRPEAKKRQKPPKPPPKPSEMRRKDPERPTALMPPRPADAELSHTQHRMRKAAAGNNEVSGNVMQTETNEKTSETPVAPPRSSSKSSGRENVQSEASKEEGDFKQNNQTFLGGMFRRSHKENFSSFTSYVTDGDKEEKSDDVTTKQAAGAKLASKEPSPEASTEEPGSEKQRSTEKNKQEKIADPKQDIGGLIAGIFRKTPKEKSSPALMVSKADSDPEEAEEATEESAERSEGKGGLFSGKPKSSRKSTDELPAQEDLSVNAELSASSDSLSEKSNNKEKGGIFSGMFKKSPKPVEAAETDKDQQSLRDDLTGSNDNLSENSKEKGAFFSGILRKSPKVPVEATPGKQTDPSDSSKTPSENNTKDKGGIFSGMFRKSPKLSEAPRLEEGGEPLHSNLSASSDSLSDNKEKGGLFSGLRKKTPKTPGEENLSAQKDLSASSGSLSEAADTREKQSHDGELSVSSETLSENNKEKGGIFSGLFKKAPKPAQPAQPDEDDSSDNSLSKSNESLSENKEEKGGGLFGGLLKKTPKASGDRAELLDKEAQRELPGSTDDLSENSSTKEKNIFSNMFKKPQKPTEDTAADKELAREKLLTGSCENLCSTSAAKEKKGGLAGIFKRSASIENLFDEDKGGLFSGLRKKTPKTPEFEAAAEDKDDWPELLRASNDSLSENTKEKTGGLIFKKSPKPAPRSTTSTDPLRDSEELSSSRDSLTETSQEKKGGLGGIFRRTPKTTEQQLLIQDSENPEKPEGGGLRRTRTIKKKRRVVSFRVKKTQMPNLDITLGSDKMPAIEEAVEMQDLNPPEESSEEPDVQPVEMAAYPTEHNPTQAELETDELMEWWNTVKGWVEWNESSNFQEDEGYLAMEQAADRVYMAARLFVRLFNQRGASLQHRILELLALADAADQFHKKTVSAAVGGGVASVAGSVATITGLILAPFTFGASIIVTAVGIGVATAGSITAATANITDTVHSNMDRKKLEKMIQGYQEEIKVIRECMEFVQAGMDTLEEWDFEKYSESAAKKALNHNLKHVMKEGGRAGKALMINTDKLISTVQILGAAGGAAKAAQAISVTTGVMSALFLALDVFFLAKDSHELRKGAKTKFASKIRDVCKELQDGLLELNKVKTQLQKTMDGIEVEEFEEIEEVEMEVDDDFESDPKKLAELEHELDLMEEKLDKKAEEVEKSKETDKQNLKNEETSLKETGETKGQKDEEERKKDDKKSEKKGKGEGENKFDPTLEKISNEDKEQKNETFKAAKEEFLKEQSEKGKKKDKETENRLTVGKEKNESKKEMPKEDGGSKSKTPEKEKERNKTGDEPKETKSRQGQSKQNDWSGKAKMERANESSKSDREGAAVMNKEKELESGSLWRHSSSSSDQGKDHRSERGSKHETKERVSSRQSNRTESWRRAEEERGKWDGRGEMRTSGEERRESSGGKESKRETEGEDRGRESHHRHEASWTREPREESDPKRSHHRRGHDDQREARDGKRGSEVASERSPFERAEAEERGRRKEEGESRRSERETRGGDREHRHSHHRHSHRGSRRETSMLLEDGLNI